MTKTGPQKYPGASLAYWYQPKYPGSAMEANVGVIHTTEGTSVPSYGGGASAPNFTALPDIPNKRLRWYQHFDFDVSSRALVNQSGGVETNTLNVVQVELVGTCDPKYRTSWGRSTRRAGTDYLFWPEASDWALAELAKFVKWCHDNHGIKLASTVEWKPYPSSYGANGVRLSGSQWRGYYGWCGHQHVPENGHGDPGNLNFARVLEHARGDVTPHDQEDDDVALTANQIRDIAAAVWGHKVDDPLQGGTATVTIEGSLHGLAARAGRIEKAVAQLAAEGAARDAVLARLAEGGGLDAAELRAATEAGAAAALDRLADALQEG